MRKATLGVPEVVRAVVASLDRVLAPMHGTGGHRDAGQATVSLFYGHGERLHSMRGGRMPRACRATPKMMAAAVVESVLDDFRGNRHRVGHGAVKA